MPTIPKQLVELPARWRSAATRNAFKGIVGDYDPKFESAAFGGSEYVARHPAYAHHWSQPGTSSGNVRKNGKSRMLLFELDPSVHGGGGDDSSLGSMVRQKFRRAAGGMVNPKRKKSVVVNNDLLGNPYDGPNTGFDDYAHLWPGQKQEKLKLIDDDVPHMYNASDRFKSLVVDAGRGDRKARHTIDRYLGKHGRYSKDFKSMIRNGGVMALPLLLSQSGED